ncbi:hypothetical protein [Rhodospirillum sp. A1_3_36]
MTQNRAGRRGNLSVFHLRVDKGKIINVSPSNLALSPDDAIT